MTKFKNPLLDYIYFWLDMFEFNLKSFKTDCFFYDELVWNIDDDNSDSAYIEIEWIKFNYDRVNISWFGDWLKFRTIVNWEIVSCFSLLKGAPMTTGKWASKDKVVLYSSFFVLDSLNFLPFSLVTFIWTQFKYSNAILYRLDICNDLPLTIKELSPIFIDLKKPSSAIWTDTKHPEFYQTYYLWEIQNKNRHSLIRIYDKVLDTWKKQKWFLYPHLEHNKDVRRIELELRPEQSKKYHKYCILDILQNKNNIISSIYCEYVNKRIPEKYHLDYKTLDLIKFEKRKFDLKASFLSMGHIPTNYLKRTYWYIKKVVNNTWYNWLLQLIFNIQHDDIFLKKNIQKCVVNILENKPYNHLKDTKKVTNITNWLNSSIDFLEHLIIYMQNNWVQQKSINKVLKKYTCNKIKLKK